VRHAGSNPARSNLYPYPLRKRSRKKMTTTELSRVDAAIEYARNELAKADPVIEQLREDYMGITVTGPDDDAGFHSADTALKRVVRLRTSVEKTRKELKADALKYGKVVDGEARRIRELIEPIESHLKKQADIVRLERARIKAEAERAREAQVQEWVQQLKNVNAPIDVEALRKMDDDEFHLHFLSARKRFEEARAAEEAREAELRRQQEELQAERERIEAERAELERLREEAKPDPPAVVEEEEPETVVLEPATPLRRQQRTAVYSIRKQLEMIAIPDQLDEYRSRIVDIIESAADQIENLIDEDGE